MDELGRKIQPLQWYIPTESSIPRGWDPRGALNYKWADGLGPVTPSQCWPMCGKLPFLHLFFFTLFIIGPINSKAFFGFLVGANGLQFTSSTWVWFDFNSPHSKEFDSKENLENSQTLHPVFGKVNIPSREWFWVLAACVGHEHVRASPTAPR
jgi:hypothetical protein